MIIKKDVKILVVDDSESDLDLITIYLRRNGYSHIKELMLSEEAIDIVKSYNGSLDSYFPNLILSDTNLPVMEGYDACSEIRKLPYGDKIAIIGMSGNSEIDYTARWINSGADGFFNKNDLDYSNSNLDALITQSLMDYHR